MVKTFYLRIPALNKEQFCATGDIIQLVAIADNKLLQLC